MLINYKCPKCGTSCDRIQKKPEEEIVKCLECKTLMKKQISVPAGRFRWRDKK